MALFLDEILRNVYHTEKEIELINVDDFSMSASNIGEEIMHIRLGRNGSNPYNGPIIVYGFDSFDNLIRRKKHQNPLLLVSPGVYYLKIPCEIDIICSTIEKAKNFNIPQEQIHQLLKEHLIEYRAKRVESIWAHKLGNFFGSEKLLYGAYLAGAIENLDYFHSSLEVIRDDQQKYLSDLASDQEFAVYHFTESMNFTPLELDRPMLPPLSGKILYIDDHAHLGWANAITIALGGRLLNGKPEAVEFDNVEFEKRKANNGKMETWNFVPCQDVDKYYNLINAFVSKDDNLKAFDIILLDLRLRGKIEEYIDETNLDKLSGYNVLQTIRKANPVIPVLMLTASRKAKNMEGLLENGADAYFVKEIMTNEETHDEIRSYHQRFRKKAKELIGKSYLTMIWRIIQTNKKKLDPAIYKCLVSAIVLLKKNFSKSEQKYFNVSVYNEVVLNIGLARDYLTKLSQSKNTFDKGFILRQLRNCVAHEKEPMTENDAKIALYSFFRMCPLNSQIKWGDFLSQLNISVPKVEGVNQENHIIFLKKIFHIICGINLNENVTRNILGKNLAYFEGIQELNEHLIHESWQPNWNDIKIIIFIYEEMCRKKLPQSFPPISEIA